MYFHHKLQIWLFSAFWTFALIYLHMPCWASFSMLKCQLLVSFLQGVLQTAVSHLSIPYQRFVGSENIYRKRVLFLFTIFSCCTCCHLCDCFLLRAVNQLTTASPKYLFWGWESCLACVDRNGILSMKIDNWIVTFPSGGFLIIICSVQCQEIEEQKNRMFWAVAKQTGSGQPGAHESHTGNSSKVLVVKTCSLGRLLRWFKVPLALSELD